MARVNPHDPQWAEITDASVESVGFEYALGSEPPARVPRSRYSLVHHILNQNLQFVNGTTSTQYMELTFESPALAAGARSSLDSYSNRHGEAQGFKFDTQVAGKKLWVRKTRLTPEA